MICMKGLSHMVNKFLILSSGCLRFYLRRAWMVDLSCMFSSVWIMHVALSVYYGTSSTHFVFLSNIFLFFFFPPNFWNEKFYLIILTENTILKRIISECCLSLFFMWGHIFAFLKKQSVQMKSVELRSDVIAEQNT